MSRLNIDLKRAKKVLGISPKPFPFSISPAPHKQFQETLVFVPFFFGKKEQMKRHIEFANNLGYDVASFTLSVHKNFIFNKIPYDINLGWGLKHIWSQEITEVLNKIPGSKIIYSFSNPTSSALEAMALRQVRDVRALVCDGGPFYDLLKCNWNYFTHERPVQGIFKKVAVNSIARIIWTRRHEYELYRDLKKLPDQFPVLSVRGWKDPLVPPSAIEKAFAPHKHLDLEVLNIPEGQHLDGLKNFPDIYQSKVSEFLENHSQKILNS